METGVISAVEPHTKGGWRLPWLTAGWCRAILAVVLVAGFASHLQFLLNNCPLDLSGDEAYYWDWSRQLDWCYYSKGPMVAWLIRASCATFGNTMVAVRLPSLVLAIGTSLLTYWLTRKLFGSERLALGAVLLNHLVPMFIAGSVMMTIDPPMFFLWAMATAFAAKAVFDERKWAWIGIGIAVGLGFLTKFSMPIWLAGLGLFLAMDQRGRRQLRTPWPWVMLAVTLLFTIPVILFNVKHGAVTLKHVGGDVGGTDKSGLSALGPLEFLATQFGMLGPALAVIMAGAVAYALGRGRSDSNARAMRFLLCIGLTFFGCVLVSSTFTKAQGNWPAPSYFTLMILSAYFLSTRMASDALWRKWRGWLWAAITIGGLCIVIMHNTELLYRPVHTISAKLSKKPVHPRQWDVAARLRGWKELGAFLSNELQAVGGDPFVLCEKYEFAGETAFYVKGQPKTYFMGTWFEDPERRARMSQYDLWADRRLDQKQLLGRNAVFLGYGQDERADLPPKELLKAFEKVEAVRHYTVRRSGIDMRTFNTWRCYGFKGMKRAGELTKN